MEYVHRMLLESSPLLLLSFHGLSRPGEYQNFPHDILCLARLDLETSSTDYRNVIQLSISLEVQTSRAFIFLRLSYLAVNQKKIFTTLCACLSEPRYIRKPPRRVQYAAGLTQLSTSSSCTSSACQTTKIRRLLLYVFCLLD